MPGQKISQPELRCREKNWGVKDIKVSLTKIES